MMNQDIEKVLISEEQIQEKVLELGAIIAEDYKKYSTSCDWCTKGCNAIHGRFIKENRYIS